MSPDTADFRTILNDGAVIPACPLALTAQRKFDTQRQRALLRYYAAAGAGGAAVGVHTTQFEIRNRQFNLFGPVLELAAEELRNIERRRGASLVKIAGICGKTGQAVSEASLARKLGFDVGLVSLAGLQEEDENALVEHCRTVGEILPVMGFYLQPSVGGRVLPYRFWRQLAEVDSVVAVKIAPFNRYQTLDVVRAVVEAGRDDIALYTGNDDNIVADLLTPFRFEIKGERRERRIVGGLLGHWAVWTSKAVELLRACRRAAAGDSLPTDLLRLGVAVTDANAAIFDAANRFRGCIPGIHEILRRQGLLESTHCLNPAETLSAGQKEEIDRIQTAYPHLNDDAFVAEHMDEWLRA